MLGRFRSAINYAMGGMGGESGEGLTGNTGVASVASGKVDGAVSGRAPVAKYPYQRPIFLQLFVEDEIQATANHSVRPIIVPRDINVLPWYSGYAEAINAGKSLRNEDQAAFHRGVLRTGDLPDEDLVSCVGDDVSKALHRDIPYIYFGIFDGHAGSGCAVSAANELHQVLHNRLMGVLQHLVSQAHGGPVGSGGGDVVGSVSWYPMRDISVENMVVGALEAAFWDMDQLIGNDKKRYKLLGGCTAVIALFILGKLYVANAGDSRGVLCRRGSAYPMSHDFTPVTERQRLQQLGYQMPHLLGAEYTHLDFCRRPMRKDVGKRMLYRDAHMTGWAYKEIQPEDVKFPIVYGEGKRSRLLATIGVTRGFGDHDLKAQSVSSNPVCIKPFLTPQPEVRVLDVENEEISDADVLVMGTDGLWDVVSNEKVANIVEEGLYADPDADNSKDNASAKYVYISIAQDLVMAARGELVERSWRKKSEVDSDRFVPATIDDISVFVVPILPYKREFAVFTSHCRKTEGQTVEGAVTNGQDHAVEENGQGDVEEGVDAVLDSDDIPKKLDKH